MLENTTKVFQIEHRCRNIPIMQKVGLSSLALPKRSIPILWSLSLYRMSLVTTCHRVLLSAVGMCISVPCGRRCSEQGVSHKLWPHYQRGGWDGCLLPLLSSTSFKNGYFIYSSLSLASGSPTEITAAPKQQETHRGGETKKAQSFILSFFFVL